MMLRFHVIRRTPFRPLDSTINNLFSGTSSVHSRSRSHAASLSSDIPKPHKPRKKISKSERQAMVESYVTKYREANAGKFPSFSDTQKQVGGCFYVIRKLVQEMEYNSRTSKASSWSSAKEENLNFVASQENTPKPDGEGASQSCHEEQSDCKLRELQSYPSDFPLLDANLEKEVDHQYIDKPEEFEKDKFRDDSSHPVAIEDHPEDPEARDSSPCLDKKEVAWAEHQASEDLVDTDDPGYKKKSSELEEEKHAKDISSRQTNGAEFPNKSTLWGNLKSIADGIINIWRKL